MTNKIVTYIEVTKNGIIKTIEPNLKLLGNGYRWHMLTSNDEREIQVYGFDKSLIGECRNEYIRRKLQLIYPNIEELKKNFTLYQHWTPLNNEWFKLPTEEQQDD